jgi:hypothetical protein
MQILLDNEPLVVNDLNGSAIVAQYLSAAKARLWGTDRMVFGLRFDGEEVPAAQIEESLSRPIEDLESLEFISACASQVVVDALRETQKTLANSFVTVREASESLSKGRLAETMERLTDCIKVWSQTHEALVQSGSILELDFERVAITGRPLLEWLGDLAKRLREIRDAIAARDHVLLSDILHYELDETLSGWEQMLGGVIQHITMKHDEDAKARPVAVAG